MFGVVCKKTFFDTNYQKCQFNLASCLHVDHSQNHFDTTNLMSISDLANEFPLKIIFFEISLIVSIYMKF